MCLTGKNQNATKYASLYIIIWLVFVQTCIILAKSFYSLLIYNFFFFYQSRSWRIYLNFSSSIIRSLSFSAFHLLFISSRRNGHPNLQQSLLASLQHNDRTFIRGHACTNQLSGYGLNSSNRIGVKRAVTIPLWQNKMPSSFS